MNVQIGVVNGDIVDFDADLIALKYAQGFYGADLAVSRLITQADGVAENQLEPPVGKHVLFASNGEIRARKVLFVGVPRLAELAYVDVRTFGSAVAEVLSAEVPDCAHLALTVHGPGFGLDEVESMLSMLDGLLEALSLRAASSLSRVSLVERDRARALRLRDALAGTRYGRPGLSVTASPSGWTVDYREHANSGASEAGEQVGLPGAPSEEKPRIFVAMPFAEEFDDLFEYGIQRPVRELGFLCERIDQLSFTGDVLARLKQSIELASATVAVITGANPNVFLEIGYAWGRGRPTILVSKLGEDSRFDVQGQRHLKYKDIRDVERLLRKELLSLRDQGRLTGPS